MTVGRARYPNSPRPRRTPAEPVKPAAGGLRPRDPAESSTQPGAARGGVPPQVPRALRRADRSPSPEAEFHPLDKNQAEKMSLECLMLWEQAAIMSQLWVGCGYFAEHILPVVMGTVGTN